MLYTLKTKVCNKFITLAKRKTKRETDNPNGVNVVRRYISASRDFATNQLQITAVTPKKVRGIFMHAAS
jgi:hypothetical protein